MIHLIFPEQIIHVIGDHLDIQKHALRCGFRSGYHGIFPSCSIVRYTVIISAQMRKGNSKKQKRRKEMSSDEDVIHNPDRAVISVFVGYAQCCWAVFWPDSLFSWILGTKNLLPVSAGGSDHRV
jgi:hypothetical protein